AGIVQLMPILMSLVVTPSFLWLIGRAGEKLIPFVTQILCKGRSKNIDRWLTRVNYVLSSFIQGQLLVSFFVGVALFIGYIIIGLNYSLTLALFGLLMNVIPFVGPFIAVAPALIVGRSEERRVGTECRVQSWTGHE